jgi:hypothetical protein
MKLPPVAPSRRPSQLRHNPSVSSCSTVNGHDSANSPRPLQHARDDRSHVVVRLRDYFREDRPETRVFVEQPPDASALEDDRPRPTRTAPRGLVLAPQEVLDQAHTAIMQAAPFALPEILYFLRDVFQIGLGRAPRPQQLGVVPRPLGEISVIQLRYPHTLMIYFKISARAAPKSVN